MKCTWKECEFEATTPQLDRGGKQWANLCDAHHAEVEGSFELGPKATLRCWVLAQGGAKAAAARMKF